MHPHATASLCLAGVPHARQLSTNRRQRQTGAMADTGARGGARLRWTAAVRGAPCCVSGVRHANLGACQQHANCAEAGSGA